MKGETLLRFESTVFAVSVFALLHAKRKRDNGKLNNGKLMTRKESPQK
jgi:hypothetical protein